MKSEAWPGVLARYRDLIPFPVDETSVTLLEGGTPLVPSRHIGPRLGLDLFFKYEGLNPTGSFKDRGMTAAMTQAVRRGDVAVICASTGNTSASAAAFAARCGLKCVVLIPEGNIAAGKLAQAVAHGAQVVAIQGNFDQALGFVRDLSERHPITLVNSVNPDRLEGQKTAAFEVSEQLGRAPEFLVIPVGNAGNISAYWMGFSQWKNAGRIDSLPTMVGFQAEGAAPIVMGCRFDHPETVATAIRIGNPVRWKQAEAAAGESGGFIDKVSDRQIIEAYRQLAQEEGLFVEPASACGVAGLIESVAAGRISTGSTVVAVLTGHGLKDPGAVDYMENKVVSSEATLEAVEELLFSGSA